MSHSARLPRWRTVAAGARQICRIGLSLAEFEHRRKIDDPLSSLAHEVEYPKFEQDPSKDREGEENGSDNEDEDDEPSPQPPTKRFGRFLRFVFNHFARR